MGKSKRFRIQPDLANKLGLALNKSNRYRLNEEQQELFFKLKQEKIQNAIDQNKEYWEENSKEAVWEYNSTTKSLETLEEALEFCEADLDKYEVDRYIFNSWDVVMKVDETPVKRTNYQVKIWFKKIEKVFIKQPFVEPVVVNPSSDVQMWVVIGCVHRPFHNTALWYNFLQFLNHNSGKITGIIINGDYLDLRSLSTHEEWIPQGIDLSMEYSDGLEGIEEIELALSNDVDKVFHYGNHEDRFLRNKKDIRKYGSSLPSPREALQLDEKGWKVVEDWKDGYTKLGNDLEVFHGEYVGMNAAKQHLEAMPEVSCLFNHTHRFQSYSHNKQTAYNVGWMGDANHDVFKYMMRRSKYRWTNGFGVVYLDEKGNHYVNPVKSEDNRIFFEGKLFK